MIHPVMKKEDILKNVDDKTLDRSHRHSKYGKNTMEVNDYPQLNKETSTVRALNRLKKLTS